MANNPNPYFPFHALGLQGNPFRVLSDEEWTAIAVVPPRILESLKRDAAHWQLLGEAGRGKSVTLLGLTAHLKQNGRRAAYEYLPAGARRFKTNLRALDIFLLDEAQRLGRRKRRRLLESATSSKLRLILSSHEDLTPLFARRALPLRSIYLDGPDAAGLQNILNRRLACFALPGAARITFSAEAVAYLTDAFGSNLRAMEQFLYEVFQKLAKEGPLEEEV